MDDPEGDLNMDVAADPIYAARWCRCINTCANDEYNSTCQLQENSKCFRKLEIIDGEVIETAGCLVSMNKYIDQCNGAAAPDFNAPTDYQCCWDRDFCNDHLQMELPTTVASMEDPTPDTTMAVALIISLMLAFMLGVFMIAICCVRFKQREKKRKRQIDAESDTYGIKSKKLGDLVAEYSTPGTCSSGSGMPLLVQRTIARQIEIIRELGRGRYGTVMLGKWRDEYVAVKMFNSTDEDSWYRETEIYQTVLLRHENILCFVASDINGTGSWTELYLITDYHENGSLHDYLQRRALTVPEALRLALTAACGLAHLHTEIIGTQGRISNQGKPAIAHRDIKSKNILVKKDGACCIADMGLAVRFSSTKENGKGELDKGKYKRYCRQGTKRYMSPEVLSGTLMEDSFDAFKASDVYSFALVLWEILNCTEVEGWDAKYHLPYHDFVGNDPDFDEMRKVVDVDNIRPDISPAHGDHLILSRYTETMAECWSRRPESRLTMLRVRKTLGSLVHGPAEQETAVPNYSQSIEYVSDRSNSSGFPTQSNDFIYDRMRLSEKQNMPSNFYNDEEKHGHEMSRQNGLTVNLPLIGNGYGESC